MKRGTERRRRIAVESRYLGCQTSDLEVAQPASSGRLPCFPKADIDPMFLVMATRLAAVIVRAAN